MAASPRVWERCLLGTAYVLFSLPRVRAETRGVRLALAREAAGKLLPKAQLHRRAPISHPRHLSRDRRAGSGRVRRDPTADWFATPCLLPDPVPRGRPWRDRGHGA